MTAVTIRDVAMRDGLQIEEPIDTAAKLELLEAICATGVREVEVTAFVSPSKVPALADAAEICRHLHRFPDVRFSALVASVNGARRALDAGVAHLEYVVSASDAHSRANVGRDTEASTALIGDIVEAAHTADATVEVIIATAWDCPFDGPTPTGRVTRIVEHAVASAADRIALADTIGTTTPRRVTELVDAVRPLVGDLPLGAHFHNTRGTGLASAYAAVQAGITRLDASVGGLGGCPFAPGASGNIATEDLVYLLRDCGVETGVDLDAAIRAGRIAIGAVGGGSGSALMRAGDRKLVGQA
ncbi:hydroxymethylglutaryl-CoA lyase [Gordonia sp. NPDC003376]